MSKVGPYGRLTAEKEARDKKKEEAEKERKEKSLKEEEEFIRGAERRSRQEKNGNDDRTEEVGQCADDIPKMFRNVSISRQNARTKPEMLYSRDSVFPPNAFEEAKKDGKEGEKKNPEMLFVNNKASNESSMHQTDVAFIRQKMKAARNAPCNPCSFLTKSNLFGDLPSGSSSVFSPIHSEKDDEKEKVEQTTESLPKQAGPIPKQSRACSLM